MHTLGTTPCSAPLYCLLKVLLCFHTVTSAAHPCLIQDGNEVTYPAPLTLSSQSTDTPLTAFCVLNDPHVTDSRESTDLLLTVPSETSTISSIPVTITAESTATAFKESTAPFLTDLGEFTDLPCTDIGDTSLSESTCTPPASSLSKSTGCPLAASSQSIGPPSRSTRRTRSSFSAPDFSKRFCFGKNLYS